MQLNIAAVVDDDGGKSGRRWVVGRKSSVRTGPSKIKKHDQGRVVQLNSAGSGGDNENEGAAWVIFVCRVKDPRGVWMGHTANG